MIGLDKYLDPPDEVTVDRVEMQIFCREKIHIIIADDEGDKTATEVAEYVRTHPKADEIAMTAFDSRGRELKTEWFNPQIFDEADVKEWVRGYIDSKAYLDEENHCDYWEM